MGKARIKLHVHHKDCMEHLFRSSWPHLSLSLANAGVTSSGSTPASFSQVQPDIMCPMLLASPPWGFSVNAIAWELEENHSASSKGSRKLCGVPMGKALTNGGWEPMETCFSLSAPTHGRSAYDWLLRWFWIQHPVALGCG